MSEMSDATPHPRHQPPVEAMQNLKNEANRTEQFKVWRDMLLRGGTELVFWVQDAYESQKPLWHGIRVEVGMTVQQTDLGSTGPNQHGIVQELARPGVFLADDVSGYHEGHHMTICQVLRTELNGYMQPHKELLQIAIGDPYERDIYSDGNYKQHGSNTPLLSVTKTTGEYCDGFSIYGDGSMKRFYEDDQGHSCSVPIESPADLQRAQTLLDAVSVAIVAG